MVACPQPRSEPGVHEVALIFPELPPARYEALKESIRAVGQIDPIWLHPDGRIIDGRHRYRACRDLGIEPRMQNWDGEGSLMGFVCALNAVSRHLTLSQKVAVAVEMVPHFEQEARERMAHGGLKALGARGVVGAVPGSAKMHYLAGRKAAEEAARAVGASTRYVYHGLRLHKTHPDLLPALRSGHLELAQARRLAQAPAERRRGYLELAATVADPDPHSTPREVHRRYCQIYGSIKENLDIIKPGDWWAFSHPKWAQDEDFPGSIPGEVYANALYYFAPLRGVAVDPMAGSGMLKRVYDDRERWQKDLSFALDVHLFDLHPSPARPFIGRHDAREPLPLHADWIFLDPPYYGQSAHLYDGALAQTADYTAYLAEFARIIEAMARSLRARGRLCLFLPKWSGCRPDDPCLDIPSDSAVLARAAGLSWVDCAYVSRGRQQDPRGGPLNTLAKRQRRMISDVCCLHVFEKGAAR